MARAPASFESIRAKLCSPTAKVRGVALLHARAHGAAGIELAADVARCAADDDERVVATALRTFDVIGVGAAAAVPVLVEHLGQVGARPQLALRALGSLRTVGAAARAALGPLRELALARPDLAGRAMLTMLAIAPQDPDVLAEVGDQILRDPLRSDALLDAAPAHVVDKVQAAAIRREDPESALLLAQLAQRGRGEAVMSRASELLSSAAPRVVNFAINAILICERSGQKLDDATFTRALQLVRGENANLRARAYELLALGGPRESTYRVALETIDRLRDAIPRDGEHRFPGLELAGAATALAATVSQLDDGAVPRERSSTISSDFPRSWRLRRWTAACRSTPSHGSPAPRGDSGTTARASRQR